MTRKCPKGKTYRKTFIRKGRRIMGKCIRSQSRSHYPKPKRGRMTRRLRGVRHAARTLKTCPKGHILRKAYMRYTKKGKHILVADACIRDIGAPGKGLRDGPGIGPLRQGDLSQFGYTGVQGMSIQSRREALKKAVATYGSLTVWRKLNAVAVYTRRTAPASSRIFKQDMDWIRITYGLKAF